MAEAGSPLTIGVSGSPRSPSRLVAKDTRVFLHCAIRDPRRPAHGMPVVAVLRAAISLFRLPSLNFGLPKILPSARARSRPALVHWLIFSRSSFGERGQGRQEDVADEFVLCRQVLFRE